MSGRVIIAIVYERLAFDSNCSRSPRQSICDERSIRVLFHPNPFFNQRVTAGEGPDGCRPVQSKTFDMTEALGQNRASAPTASAELVVTSIVFDRFFEMG